MLSSDDYLCVLCLCLCNVLYERNELVINRVMRGHDVKQESREREEKKKKRRDEGEGEGKRDGKGEGILLLQSFPPMSSSAPFSPPTARETNAEGGGEQSEGERETRGGEGSSAPPVWQADSSASECGLCLASFSLLTRRHHCRSCLMIFCAVCCPKRAQREGQRVCDKCMKGNQMRSSQHFSSSASNNSPTVLLRPDVLRLLSSLRVPSVLCAETELYRTLSLCAHCAFIERAGFEQLVPSHVFTTRNSVFLRILCPRHPPRITLLSSNLSHYLYLNTFLTPPASLSLPLYSLPHRVASPRPFPIGSAWDIEEAHKWLSYRSAASRRSLPLMFEITLFREDSGFLTSAQLYSQLIAFASNYKEEQSFAVKFVGGLIQTPQQIEQMNSLLLSLVETESEGKTDERTQTAHSDSSKDAKHSTAQGAFSSPPSALVKLLRNCEFLIDLTSERMIDLSALPNTVLLRMRVFPVTKFYLEAGQYENFSTELSSLCDHLSSIRGLQLILNLAFLDPLPSMEEMRSLYSLLTVKYRHFIKFIQMDRERSPKEIFAELTRSMQRGEREEERESEKEREKQRESGKEREAHSDTDSYALLSLLAKASSNALTPFDFLPISCCSLLNEFVSELKYLGLNVGSFPLFSLAANPNCASAALLLSTASVSSVPLSRVFNVQSLYFELRTIVDSFLSGNTSKWGLLKVKSSVQRALFSALLPSAPIAVSPDILSYLHTSQPSALQEMQQFFNGLQLIVYHNRMDFASVDMVRREQCGLLCPHPNAALQTNTAAAPYVAACTGCI